MVFRIRIGHNLKSPGSGVLDSDLVKGQGEIE